jgi:hydrogenase expression/formation protein HypE
LTPLIFANYLTFPDTLIFLSSKFKHFIDKYTTGVAFIMDRLFIELDHGSGGEASAELVQDIFLARLDNDILRNLDDSAEIQLPSPRAAMTTDSYVVDPIFFPGGDIGSLAVNGTVNDLSVQGAKPLYLNLALILEEGLPISTLENIIDSIAVACDESHVKIVSGDTKVVPKGHADKIFINTSGIGLIPEGINVASKNAREGDLILINGDIGNHGIALLSKREGLDFKSSLVSDCAPLNSLVSSIFDTSRHVHVLRDPTRGGLATALNEIASRSAVGIRIFEDSLPIQNEVLSASEMLGLDPLYVANEGKCVVFVAKEDADDVLNTMKRHKYGKRSKIIGEVISGNPGKVLLKTRVGGTRILSMLTGEQLPRIC